MLTQIGVAELAVGKNLVEVAIVQTDRERCVGGGVAAAQSVVCAAELAARTSH